LSDDVKRSLMIHMCTFDGVSARMKRFRRRHSMNVQKANIVRAFLQGFTGAGLFRRLNYPGAPTEFVDSRSIDEIIASGEFDETCRNYLKAIEDGPGPQG